jgi:hypothetical protein
MLSFQIVSVIGTILAGIVLIYAYVKRHPEILN